MSSRTKAMQVLVHGATLSKVMWDFPYQLERYSWVRHAASEGLSTFAFDQVGAGNSPNSDGLLEAQCQTYVETIHQLVEMLRGDETGGKKFDKVIIIGFSPGSVSLVSLAKQYPADADALVLRGFPWNAATLYQGFFPGLQEAAALVDPQKWGYLPNTYTTRSTPASREATVFYGNFNPGIVHVDLELRDLDTLGASITIRFHSLYVGRQLSALGTEIALKALSSGQRVIRTVRNRTKVASQVFTIEAKGGKILELVVTDAAACPAVFKKAESLYGQVDVLVNNARYSLLGAVEDLGEEEARTQMETNFFGPQRLIRAALPGFCTRKTGTIVNITSVAGIDGLPSCGLYAASKFALGGLSESLASETAPFNINVLIVEPGAFRTNFLSAIGLPKKPHTEDYENVKAVFDKFSTMAGRQRGDPVKAAARIFEAVSGQGIAGHLRGKALRMPLGKDCVERFEVKIKTMGEDLEKVREIAESTSF